VDRFGEEDETSLTLNSPAIDLSGQCAGFGAFRGKGHRGLQGRCCGSALGALVSAIAASYFGPNLPVFAICVFILGLVCAVLRPDRTVYRFGAYNAGNRAVDAPNGSCTSDRISIGLRNVDWNCGGTDFDSGVSGEGDRNIREKVNFSIPTMRPKHR
jgi:hypothetical protein